MSEIINKPKKASIDESSNLSSPTTNLLCRFNEKIVKTLWELRKLSPSSQRSYAKKILQLGKKTNLDESLQTEKYIRSLKGASKYKSTLLMAYFHYCKSNLISWTPPKFKCQSMPIVVPHFSCKTCNTVSAFRYKGCFGLSSALVPKQYTVFKPLIIFSTASPL